MGNVNQGIGWSTESKLLQHILKQITRLTGLISNLTSTVPTDISQLTDTTNVIPSDVSELSDTTNLIPPNSKTVYTVFLTQTGTNAPVATIVEDTITGLVWARSAAGVYTLTKAGAFTLNKTVPVDDVYMDVDDNMYTAVRTSADVITLTTYASTNLTTPTDAVLSNQYFHIEIYY
jgi:hypothetical protein